MSENLENTVWRNNKTENNYVVLFVGQSSETLEKLVIYQREDKDVSPMVWVRPYILFLKKFTKVDN